MTVETDDALRRLVDAARQVVRERVETQQDAPLYLTWFALGHVAVLVYLAVRALQMAF